MTIKELSKYHTIKTEIQQLQDNIVELENTIIGASKISDIPSSSNGNSNPTERIAFRLGVLKGRLNDKLNDLMMEQVTIEEFLETVDDNNIRIIIRSRFIDGKKWEQIGEDLNYDRTTPYYQLKKYLKGRKNEEKKNENKGNI